MKMKQMFQMSEIDLIFSDLVRRIFTIASCRKIRASIIFNVALSSLHSVEVESLNRPR